MLCPKCKKSTLTKIPLLEKAWSCMVCGYQSSFYHETINQALLTSLKEIPKGKVTTYKVLADKFGLHHRAVARILASNKLPNIFPCYKVVNSDGSVGGYIGGKSRKTALLHKDGIVVKNNKIDLTDYLYVF